MEGNWKDKTTRHLGSRRCEGALAFEGGDRLNAHPWGRHRACSERLRSSTSNFWRKRPWEALRLGTYARIRSGDVATETPIKRVLASSVSRVDFFLDRAPFIVVLDRRG